MIECESHTIDDHKDPFQRTLVPLLKFKRKRQQVEEKPDGVQVQNSADIEHDTATHYPDKTRKVDMRKQRRVEKVKDNTPCRIQEHDH